MLWQHFVVSYIKDIWKTLDLIDETPGKLDEWTTSSNEFIQRIFAFFDSVKSMHPIHRNYYIFAFRGLPKLASIRIELHFIEGTSPSVPHCIAPLGPQDWPICIFTPGLVDE